MKATLTIEKQIFNIDVSKPLDISVPIKAQKGKARAWYIDAPEVWPVKLGDWVGSVKEGAAVNFNNVYFNPHAHGTHTECVGHISEAFHSVHETLKRHFFLTEVISVAPETKEGDFIISEKQLKHLLRGKKPEAVVIRTLPNLASKKTKKYSNTHWPYVAEKAATFLREIGVNHLLIDLPSVDKEKDEGKLLAHKAFWDYPQNPRFEATITEFIFVSNTIKDGSYILNLQTAPLVNDASPSRPVLYKILK
ncbi:MAG: cyclase family protein [Flavobacteriaceae bacterium]